MAGRVLLPPLSAVRRLPDADDRLRELLASRLESGFAWGAHDCALWAADAVQAQLGVDPAQALRGTYRTARNAMRVMRGQGGLRAIAGEVLGHPLAAPLLARMGDVGLTQFNSLAVCAGSWWAAPTRHGLARLPLSQAQVAWRVGHA